MTGNVWEWTKDDDKDDDDVEGGYKRIRGGAWYNFDDSGDWSSLRADYRGSYSGLRPGYRISFVGFRCVAPSQDSKK